MNSFFKIESYLLPDDDQLPLTHFVAQTEVVHSLVQRLWNVSVEPRLSVQGNVLNKRRFCGKYKTTLRKKLPNGRYNAL